MDDNDFEELDIEEVIQKPMTKTYHGSRTFKKTLETFSTNSCTFDFDKQFSFPTHMSKYSDSYLGSKSSKTCRKRFSELPERLSGLKQITENKIKFLRIEKDIKELEDCTFKPKTNTRLFRRSLSYFTKQQEEYKKSKNSKMTKLQFQYSTSNANCETNLKTATSKKLKQGSSTVHDRLYKDSKVFSKYSKLRKKC